MARSTQRTPVFGISVDTFFALKAFQDQQKLNFPAEHFNKEVIRDYGVFNEDMIGLKASPSAPCSSSTRTAWSATAKSSRMRNEPDYKKVLDGVACSAGVPTLGPFSRTDKAHLHLGYTEHMNCSYVHG